MDVNGKSSTGLDANIASLLAYLFSWIGALVFLFIEKESQWVRFNAAQSLVVSVAYFILTIVISVLSIILVNILPFLGIIFTLISGLLGLVYFIYVVFAIINVLQKKEFVVKPLASIVEKVIGIGAAK